MVTILHVIQDNKFNNVLKRFEGDERVINKKVLILPSKNYRFKYIENKDEIILLYSNKELKKFFTEEVYDVIWFHSLDYAYYHLFHYIPNNKKIVWWTWGWEIYDSYYGLKPLVKVNLYKPETEIIVRHKESQKGGMKVFLKKYVLKYYYGRLRDMALSRIDYFVPVLPTEYSLMAQNPLFRAAELSFPEVKHKAVQTDIVEKKPMGSILLGNSATFSMNHVDVIKALGKMDLKGRQLVIPLSYGEKGCAEIVKNAIDKTEIEAIILTDFMPKEDYHKIMNNCSYAIFGMMRQQAMANVYYCLKQGIKVFMYRDSIPYCFLKNIGAVVYAIEDITLEELQTPIKVDDTIRNREVLKEKAKDGNVLFERFLNEIENEKQTN